MKKYLITALLLITLTLASFMVLAEEYTGSATTSLDVGNDSGYDEVKSTPVYGAMNEAVYLDDKPLFCLATGVIIFCALIILYILCWPVKSKNKKRK
jgi:hypothetical protein